MTRKNFSLVMFLMFVLASFGFSQEAQQPLPGSDQKMVEKITLVGGLTQSLQKAGKDLRWLTQLHHKDDGHVIQPKEFRSFHEGDFVYIYPDEPLPEDTKQLDAALAEEAKLFGYKPVRQVEPVVAKNLNSQPKQTQFVKTFTARAEDVKAGKLTTEQFVEGLQFVINQTITNLDEDMRKKIQKAVNEALTQIRAAAANLPNGSRDVAPATWATERDSLLGKIEVLQYGLFGTTFCFAIGFVFLFLRKPRMHPQLRDLIDEISLEQATKVLSAETSADLCPLEVGKMRVYVKAAVSKSAEGLRVEIDELRDAVSLQLSQLANAVDMGSALTEVALLHSVVGEQAGQIASLQALVAAQGEAISKNHSEVVEVMAIAGTEIDAVNGRVDKLEALPTHAATQIIPSLSNLAVMPSQAPPVQADDWTRDLDVKFPERTPSSPSDGQRPIHYGEPVRLSVWGRLLRRGRQVS